MLEGGCFIEWLSVMLTQEKKNAITYQLITME
jgi:hypothetical protein